MSLTNLFNTFNPMAPNSVGTGAANFGLGIADQAIGGAIGGASAKKAQKEAEKQAKKQAQQQQIMQLLQTLLQSMPPEALQEQIGQRVEGCSGAKTGAE